MLCRLLALYCNQSRLTFLWKMRRRSSEQPRLNFDLVLHPHLKLVAEAGFHF